MSSYDSVAMEVYIREIRQIPLLTAGQESELTDKVRTKGDLSARARMINSNLRLVVSVAQEYTNLGLPLPDLVSEGNIGLMAAVDRFDPGKGVRFSTFAVWWIKQGIRRAIANQGKIIRLPVHFGDKVLKMRRVTLQLSQELEREPTDDELGNEIGIASGKISHLRIAAISPVSLDSPISDRDQTNLGESVADEAMETPFEAARNTDLSKKIRDLVEQLEGREKEIICQRFGFEDGKGKTREEIGLKLGVSGERVRQVESKALTKLRRALNQNENPNGFTVVAA